MAPYRDNRYGASGGGPVRLPRLYNGANRTFWYYAWEANKWGAPQTFTGTVPTEAERGGDFSALLRLGANYQIYDPFTTAPAPGGRFTRLPLAGNIIPAEPPGQGGREPGHLYPLPNQPGTSDGRNNFFHSTTAKEDYYVHLARVDHAFSARITAPSCACTTTTGWRTRTTGTATGCTGIILMRINRGIGARRRVRAQPTLVLNVRYGLSNQEFPENRISRGYDLGKLGFSQNLLSLIDGRRGHHPAVRRGRLFHLLLVGKRRRHQFRRDPHAGGGLHQVARRA